MDSNIQTSQKELTPQTPPQTPPQAPAKAPEIVITSSDATQRRRQPIRRRYTFPPTLRDDRCRCYDRNAYKRELDLKAYSKTPSSFSLPFLSSSSSSIVRFPLPSDDISRTTDSRILSQSSETDEPFSLDSMISDSPIRRHRKCATSPATPTAAITQNILYSQHNESTTLAETRDIPPLPPLSLSLSSSKSKPNYPEKDVTTDAIGVPTPSSSPPNPSSDNVSLLSPPKINGNYYYSYTGLSSPGLLPMKMNGNNYGCINDDNQHRNIDDTGNNCCSEMFLPPPSISSGSKQVTEDFLFRSDWPQEITPGRYVDQRPNK